MGKHNKSHPYGDHRAGRGGTDSGGSFSSMSGEQKGQEFDASHSDPKGYADRNFSHQDGKHRK